MPKAVADSEVIGEMMLAKSVLEEKNELLERKEAQLHELGRRLEAAEAHLVEQRGEKLRLLEAIVRLAGDFLPDQTQSGAGSYDPDASLAGRLLSLLMKEFGVTAIDCPEGELDPAIHEVADVQTQPAGAERIVKLKDGFRLGARVLRPMRVRVFGGGR